jgi:hypothetical protein
MFNINWLNRIRHPGTAGLKIFCEDILMFWRLAHRMVTTRVINNLLLMISTQITKSHAVMFYLQCPAYSCSSNAVTKLGHGFKITPVAITILIITTNWHENILLL